jgi:LysM repeat protein
MNPMRQVLFGIAAALLSAGIVLGAFSLALTEGMERVTLLPSPSETETRPVVLNTLVVPTSTAAQAEPPSPSQTAGPGSVRTNTPTMRPTFTPSTTATLKATPTAVCNLPDGWPLITVQEADTLEELAKIYNTDKQVLIEKNCLISETLIPGTRLAVPELPDAATLEPSPTLMRTAPTISCTRPIGWVDYPAKSGDTLYNLSRRLGISANRLINANCQLRSPNLIQTGETIWLPFLPPPPPSPTETELPASPTSEPPSPTVEPPTPTLTLVPPTPVPTETILSTPSPAPTEAPTVAPSATPVTPDPPTATEEPTVSPEL